jgi:hypothetical protein
MFNCPSCRAELKLSLVLNKYTNDTKPAIPTNPTPLISANFEITGKSYILSNEDIFKSIEGVRSIIRTYYIEARDRSNNVIEYPIKQVVRGALKTNYPEFTEMYFTAHRARDILRKLGFEVKRR